MKDEVVEGVDNTDMEQPKEEDRTRIADERATKKNEGGTEKKNEGGTATLIRRNTLRKK